MLNLHIHGIYLTNIQTDELYTKKKLLKNIAGVAKKNIYEYKIGISVQKGKST